MSFRIKLTQDRRSTVTNRKVWTSGKKGRRVMHSAARANDRTMVYCPLPVSGRPWGLPTLLSNTLYVALSVPVLLGVKYIVRMHVPPGFSGFPDVLPQGGWSL